MNRSSLLIEAQSEEQGCALATLTKLNNVPVVVELHGTLNSVKGTVLSDTMGQSSEELKNKLYDQYSMNMIPPLGHVVAGDWQSYQYLVESIRKFPDQKTFCSMIEDAGFRSVRYEDLTFGVTSIHSGYKL